MPLVLPLYPFVFFGGRAVRSIEKRMGATVRGFERTYLYHQFSSNRPTNVLQ
jgi:hypothetical protein